MAFSVCTLPFPKNSSKLEKKLNPVNRSKSINTEDEVEGGCVGVFQEGLERQSTGYHLVGLWFSLQPCEKLKPDRKRSCHDTIGGVFSEPNPETG